MTVWAKDPQDIQRIFKVGKRSHYLRTQYWKIRTRNGKPVMAKGGDITPPGLKPGRTKEHIVTTIMYSLVRASRSSALVTLTADRGDFPAFPLAWWIYFTEKGIIADGSDKSLPIPAPDYSQIVRFMEAYFETFKVCAGTLFILSKEPLKIPWPAIKRKRFLIYWNPLGYKDVREKRVIGSIVPGEVNRVLVEKFPKEVKNFHKKYNINVPPDYWKYPNFYDIYGEEEISGWSMSDDEADNFWKEFERKVKEISID